MYLPAEGHLTENMNLTVSVLKMYFKELLNAGKTKAIYKFYTSISWVFVSSTATLFHDFFFPKKWFTDKYLH